MIRMPRTNLEKTSTVEDGISKDEIKRAIVEGRLRQLVRRRLKATE